MEPRETTVAGNVSKATGKTVTAAKKPLASGSSVVKKPPVKGLTLPKAPTPSKPSAGSAASKVSAKTTSSSAPRRSIAAKSSGGGAAGIDRSIAARADYAGAQQSTRDMTPAVFNEIRRTAAPSYSPMEDRAIASRGIADYAGAQSSMRDVMNERRAAPAEEERVATSWWDDFWDDQNDYRDEQIDRRAAAGVTPSAGIVDWNGLRYDLNAPYRERQAREAAEENSYAAPGSPEAFNIRVSRDGYGGAQSSMRDALIARNAPSAIDELSAMDTDARAAAGGYPVSYSDVLGMRQTPGARPDINPGSPFGPRERQDVAERLAPDPVIPRSAGGIDTALTADVALPRRRPDTAMSSAAMALPGQVEGAIPASYTPTAPSATDVAEATAPKSSLLDDIIDGAGNMASNTLLGSAVKGLFPDMWYGGLEAIKGLDNGTYRPAATANDQPRRQPRGTKSNYDNRYKEGHGRDDDDDDDNGGNNGGGGGGGGGTPTPGGPIYDRDGYVIFPDLPPYNPGVDDEWLYFRNTKPAGYAAGGLVDAYRYAEGGAVGYAPRNPGPPTGGLDPRMALIADAEDALAGEIPNPEPVLAAFVEAFGEAALEKLAEHVGKGLRLRGKGSRLVRGPGGPKDDAIPARINGTQEAKLSDGEFVMTADAVAAAGDGDPRAGADRLTQLNDMLSGQQPGPTEVEVVE